MKRGQYKKRNITTIRKECLHCGKIIVNKLLFFPSTFDRVKFCSYECKWKGNRGKRASELTKEKMRKSHIGIVSWNKGIPLSDEHRKAVSTSLRGEKHWNWQGGKTSGSHMRRNLLEYRQWRESVFKRDGFKCKINNTDCVHEVHAHHILRFSEYPELRFDIQNGITLCKNHHPMKRQHEQELEPIFRKLIS